MPSSVRQPRGPLDPRGLAFPASYRPDDVLISTVSEAAIGNELVGSSLASAASRTYPSSNTGLGFMFSLTDPFLVRKVFWVNGTTATTDKADVAVYSEDGATRIVAGGGVTVATANVVQETDTTDTLLMPGRYWLVYAQGGTTATPMGYAAGAAGILRAAGIAQMANASTAGVLGTTWTPAAVTSTIIPLFGIAARTQVA